MSIFESSIYVHPQFPVEFALNVDNTTIRVAIEWNAIERLMGTGSANVEQVRDFLHRHRAEIGIAIEAHVAARESPLNGLLMVSFEDFCIVDSLRRASADLDRCASDKSAEETHASAGVFPFPAPPELQNDASVTAGARRVPQPRQH